MRTNNRAVAVLRRGNQLLLVHRFLGGREYYVFPGGGVESEETAADAVVREAREEIGVEVKKCRLLFSLKHQRDEQSPLVEHHFYEISEWDNHPVWVAEGREAHSEDNQFFLEWVDIGEIANFDIKPTSCIQLLSDCFS